MSKWITFEDYSSLIFLHTDYSNSHVKIKIKGKYIILPTFNFDPNINYIILAQGIAASMHDDVRFLNKLNHHINISYSSLIHIAINHQNTNIMEWLISRTKEELDLLESEKDEIITAISIAPVNSTTHLLILDQINETFDLIWKDIVRAYKTSSKYPDKQDKLRDEFSIYFPNKFKSKKFIRLTAEVKQLYERN